MALSMSAPLQFLASCIPGQNISAVLAGIPDAGPRSRDPHPINRAAIVRRFALRRYQCSPDRAASRNRRRMLARGGHMPPDVRVRYIEGEANNKYF